MIVPRIISLESLYFFGKRKSRNIQLFGIWVRMSDELKLQQISSFKKLPFDRINRSFAVSEGKKVLATQRFLV